MRNYRMSKGETEHWNSFEDMAISWGKKPIKKKTDDKVKLAKQQEEFCSKYICKVCGKPMTYIDGVVGLMCCTNEKCSGIKNEKIIDENTGEKRIWYTPSYLFLKGKGAEIAENIFS